MFEGHDSPADALQVLGNEIRIAILRELAEAEQSLPFSELRERVGLSDPGKFHYHLSKCCEYFVRQTDGAYELGPAGTRVIAATDPGAPTDGGRDESTATPIEPEECPVCGEPDCEKLFHVHLTPPWR